MHISNTKITKLFTALQKNGIISEVLLSTPLPDECKMHAYSCNINSTKNFSDGREWMGTAGGFSFSSKKLALVKCLCETVERFSNATYRQKNFLYTSFKNIKTPALDPLQYISDTPVRESNLAWVKGYDVIKKEFCYIPTQLVYFSYKLQENEPSFSEFNSTGAAAGFDHESTLLRAIYEIIERDAFICIYLTKSPVSKIDISNLKNERAQYIVYQAKRYNLELHLFNITTDLSIPTFMSVLIDRTGFGPSFSVGLKASLNINNAIIGALEESFHLRPWLRQELMKQKTNLHNFPPKEITTIPERALFWMQPHMLKHIDFLLNQPIQKMSLVSPRITPEKELENLLKLLRKKDICLYSVDITPRNFKKIGIVVYKAIMPQLQSFYLNENHKKINLHRLKEVSLHFGKKTYIINRIPHPFL
jgi:ribosomal protein S12 methylthiotransferase accessory factor